MKIKKTKIDGLWIIVPELKKDSRGFFARTFDEKVINELGVKFHIVQTNTSLTKLKGSIRGMHFQEKPYQEDKIVRCIKGEIFDVAVDLRKNSPTYGKWESQILNSANNKALLIKKGFAHGFQTLTDNCEILYYMSEYFSPKHASGIRWNDPTININWPIKPTYISDKDSGLPFIK